MAPLRVCHLITDLDTGGAERSLVNLVTRLDKVRFENDVVSLLDPGPMVRSLIAAGIPVTSLGMRRGRPSLSALMAFIRHLRATRPAVLQTWLYHADLLGTAAAFFMPPESLLWNVRCTDMTVTGNEPRLRRVVRLLAMLSGRPDAIVVNSKRGRSDHVAMGYKPKHWAEIPNGVDLDRFQPRQDEKATLRKRLGLSADAVTIGLVARDHPMKDVETFLRAAALFRTERQDLQFVLCGDGFDAANKSLADTIAGLGLQRDIVLLGRRTDMELVYPAFDILTLCSIYGEGFPNVLTEAMACGVPCVTTNIGDSAEIVGDTGVIVPTRNPQSLADSWRAMLERGTEAAGKSARARIAADYGLDRMCADYEALYRSLAVSGAAVPA
jgi:glycosyltransferase involved in cell wall biosynthesis